MQHAVEREVESDLWKRSSPVKRAGHQAEPWIAALARDESFFFCALPDLVVIETDQLERWSRLASDPRGRKIDPLMFSGGNDR